MKVSIQQDLPEDEFQRRFGAIAGAGYDEAHAALLRAQGIKTVNLEQTFGVGGAPQVVDVTPVALPAPMAATEPPSETDAPPAVDLAPLYGIFVQLADALTETRQKLEDVRVDQAKVNQAILTTLDEIIQGLHGSGPYGGIINGIMVETKIVVKPKDGTVDHVAGAA